MHEAVIQTTCEISAVQTSLQKMNDIRTNQKKTVQMTPPDHSSRDSIISAYKGEADVGAVYTIGDSGETTADSQLTQQNHHTKGHPLGTNLVRESTSHDYTTEKQRTRSESAYNAGTKPRRLPLRHVQSDDSCHHAIGDSDDPQLKEKMEQRRELLKATSNRDLTD